MGAVVEGILLYAVFYISFGVIIGVHEWGHYAVARRYKTHVPSFNIGFGPRLYQWRRGKTTFHLRLLPLGGWVSLPMTYRLTRWQRIKIALAGPAVNLVLGVVLFGGGLAAQLYLSEGEAVTSSSPDWKGFVGLAQLLLISLREQPYLYLMLMGFLSCAAGVLNLLPLPPFDGGRILSDLLFPKILGRPPDAEDFYLPEVIYIVVTYLVMAYLLYSVLSEFWQG